MSDYRFKRIFVIVMDSVGCGHAKDAANFNDEGANTLLHIDEATKGLHLPTLEKLGLGNFENYKFVKPLNPDHAYIARLNEKSTGKDTITGHWEMMGLHVKDPFLTFTDTGFPKELLDELSKQTGHGIIGNCAASGTEIIKDLGERQLKTKELIVYTSSDSVLQIAAHEDVIPISELYSICEIARKICMKDEWKVARIIARPYIGTAFDNFKRTPRRHDYAIPPIAKTYLDYMKENNFASIAVGKINDIFNGSGTSEFVKTENNADGMKKTMEYVNSDFTGLCFVNLVDFDMEYGHRRDPEGYCKCLEEFDADLKVMLDKLSDDDLLILTADHGNDPTWSGSDHTREQVPFIAYSKSFKGNGKLAEQDTFGVIGATVIDNFKIKPNTDILGKSLLDFLK